MNAMRLRQTIEAAVTELGHGIKLCHESVLIQEGYYFGRQFRYDSIRAIWFEEEETVKLYGDDGRVLGTISLADEATTMATINMADEPTANRRAA